MKIKLLLLTALSMGMCITSNAQAVVSTNGKRHVLLEKGTGAWCPHCSDGIAQSERALANTPGTIVVASHDGDGMAFADGDAFNSAMLGASTPGQHGYPFGTVDRVPNGVDMAINRGSWDTKVKDRAKVAPDFDIRMTHKWNQTAGEITITLTAKALKTLTGAFNTNVYVLEDSLTGSGSLWDQANGSSYNNNPAHKYYNAGTTMKNFYHMHVLRAYLDGPWGTKGVIKDNPKAGDSVVKTYTFKVPKDGNGKFLYNTRRLHLVGVVQAENSDIKKRFIANAVDAKFDVTTGVDDVKAVNSLNVYPNPARDHINFSAGLTVSATATVIITNAIGQIVSQQQYQPNGQTVDGSISLDNFRNGIYLFTIDVDGVKTSQRIVVNR